MCSWLYIVEKILQMASQPVKEALLGIRNKHDSQIALNSCHILSKLVAELSAEAMGINVRLSNNLIIHSCDRVLEVHELCPLCIRCA